MNGAGSGCPACATVRQDGPLAVREHEYVAVEPTMRLAVVAAVPLPTVTSTCNPGGTRQTFTVALWSLDAS